MRGKQKVSLILVVTMVLGTVLTGNTVLAMGENEQNQMKVKISTDSGQSVEQGIAQTVYVTAQGQWSKQVHLNLYLKNEDGTAATEINTLNFLTKD